MKEKDPLSKLGRKVLNELQDKPEVKPGFRIGRLVLLDPPERGWEIDKHEGTSGVGFPE